MFQFESLELLYWDCWERFKIPLDGRVITITGPNGSGKTTFLDALRTLLAAKTSEKRDYKKYARRPGKPHSWIVSIVTNKRNGSGRQPFFPIMKEKVTLACHINKKGGDWQRHYYILPGALSLEEVMNIANDPPDVFCKPKGVREYQIEMEKAGLSHAMLTVLALEQGATDKLCEYRPKELLQLVYAAFGDKPTLDNYEQALDEQGEAEKELETLRVKVDRLSSQCSDLTNRVNNYREYEGLNSGRIKLETEVMAQAGYVELNDGIRGLADNILGLKRKVAASKEREAGLKENEKGIATEEAEMKASKELKETALKEVQSALVTKNGKRSVIETQLDEIRRLKEECEGVEPEPLEPLRNSLEEAQRKKFHIEQRLAETDRSIRELMAERVSLQANRLMPERAIESFHERLKGSEIGHTFLYENIEVVDERWRVAIESILKGFRYVILLNDPSDRWRAWEMGEDNGYRHFIVGEKGDITINAAEGSALEVVRLSEDVPEWIRRLLSDIHLVESVKDGKKLPEGVTFVTAKGFIRERRGGRSIAVHGADFAFGEAGRKKRLESVERRIAESEAEKKEINEEMKEVDTGVSDLQNSISLQETLQRYLSRKDEEYNLKGDLQSLLKSIDDLQRRQETLFREKAAIEERLIDLLIALLMAEGERSGFVFIDEPFAHLDVFNIDRVAEFLLATDTQYIITSPNTHNTNVYRPSSLTIVTRKKPAGRLFADPPGHLRRMEAGHA